MSSDEKITVGRYLFRRLHELGVRGVHGVPGDFNLATLDTITEAGLTWIGNCNELNAGYAADGYARVKGISALMTTFGVGELSAIAAVAGAYSEHVPLVHIVGVPNTAAQKSGLLLHHTLGNGDFQVFEEMYRKITVSSTHLRDPARAAEDIDRILETCFIASRPVYIALPTDVALTPIYADPLKRKLRTEVKENNPEYEDEVISEILKMIYSSKNTVVLADACAIRHRVLEELHQLVGLTGFTTFVTPMGKGGFDETSPQFGGVYIGDASRPEVQKRMENAECILYVGGLQSDFNTAGFTFRITTSKTVEFHSDHMKIRNATYPLMHMKPLLRTLLKRIDKSSIPPQPDTSSITNARPAPSANPNEDPNSPEITHAYLWPLFGKYLQEDDVVCTETGTANFGIIESVFPPGVTLLSQVLWGSIGYSVGCCQGAALAAKEVWEEGGKVVHKAPEERHTSNRRVILWVGDGSLQLTAQEISTMIRLKLSPIIFVINNKGFAIERRIHGLDASYNDIQEWDLKHLLPLFGADESKGKYLCCKNKKEFEHVLFGKGKGTLEEDDGKGIIRLVEVFMPQLDVPRALGMTADATAKLNQRMLGK